MNTLRVIWFFMWRMVAWMILCGTAVGVLIAVLIEASRFYAGGGFEEVVGALGRGALIGGSFGVLPGVPCGLGLAVFTLAFPRLPERTGRYRTLAVAMCTGVVLLPAGLLALLANDYEGVGPMLFLSTTFQLVGIPLLISAPFAAWAARSVATAYAQRARLGPR